MKRSVAAAAARRRAALSTPMAKGKPVHPEFWRACLDAYHRADAAPRAERPPLLRLAAQCRRAADGEVTPADLPALRDAVAALLGAPP